jgi:hypothetical protein
MVVTLSGPYIATRSVGWAATACGASRGENSPAAN